jgi:hypothetical protein
MTEKRYRGNKYIHCYCARNADVLVGAKMYSVANPVGFLCCVVLILWIAFSNADTVIKFSAFSLLGIPWIIGIWADYASTKRRMLKAKHSSFCSRKIAQWVMVYGSLWSEFKIMKSKDDGKRSWW